MKKQQLNFFAIIVLLCTMSNFSIYAQSWNPPVPTGSTMVSGTQYYLYNTGSKAFLHRGGEWGSQAIVFPTEGALIKPVLSGSLYTLEFESSAKTLFCDDVTNRFIYTDNTKNDGTTTNNQYNIVQTDAVNNIYTIQVRSDYAGYDASQYVGSTPTYYNSAKGGIVYDVRYNRAASDYTNWKFCTASDVAQYNARVVLDKYMTIAQKVGSSINLAPYILCYNDSSSALITAAANRLNVALAPTDKTSTISNPTFASSPSTGWTASPTSYGYNYQEVEYWQKTPMSFNQSLTGLPAGVYILKVQGYERPKNNSTTTLDYWTKGYDARASRLFAKSAIDSSRVPLRSVYSETASTAGTTIGTYKYPNNMSDANVAFGTNGLYDNESGSVIVGSDGALQIGLNNTYYGGTYGQGEWVVFDNFRLYYYGALSIGLTLSKTSVNFSAGTTSTTVTLTGKSLTGDITITAPTGVTISGANVSGTWPTYTIVATNVNLANEITVLWDGSTDVNSTNIVLANSSISNQNLPLTLVTSANLASLQTVINNATALYNKCAEGTGAGNASAENRQTLNSAINAAQTIHDTNTSTLAEINTAITTLNSAVAAFKTTIISDAHSLADGLYYIYINGDVDYYLSDVWNHNMPVNGTSHTMYFQPKYGGDTISYQVYKLTYDATTLRYKIEGKYRYDNPSVYKHSSTGEAQSYVNEGGKFGGNVYSNAWNTMNIISYGNSFAIQRGGSAGTNYWIPSGYTNWSFINTEVGANGYDYAVYKIVPATDLTTNINKELLQNVQVWGNNGSIYVRELSKESENHRIEVYTMLGQKVFDQNLTNNGTAVLNNKFVSGSYIVSIETNGKRVNTKVILN